MRLLVIAVVMSACYSPSPPRGAPCTTSGECPDGLACIANVCGGSATDDAAAGPDACATSARCDGEQLITCDGAVKCDYGCSDAPAPHCLRTVPTYPFPPTILDGATTTVREDKASFDTETGEIKVMNTVLRPPGEGVLNGIGFYVLDEVAVFTAHRFELAAEADWDAEGPRPIALFAATSIDIAGTLDVGSEYPNAGGPGGFDGGTSANNPGCRGRAGTWSAPGYGAGGGGGGASTPGGDGGGATNNTGGAGGAMCELHPSTIPLRGGNGGGAGGVDTNGTVHGGSGGGGGGGIALVALEAITISGTVTAPGGGGNTSTNADGGGGGGSGGAIFVEAATVNLTGALTANGGGGAAPTNADGSRGYRTSATPANGGTSNNISGGDGGAGTIAPGAGGTHTDTLLAVSRGAGGGGAAGTIRIRRKGGTLDGLTSPPAIVEEAVVE